MGNGTMRAVSASGRRHSSSLIHVGDVFTGRHTETEDVTDISQSDTRVNSPRFVDWLVRTTSSPKNYHGTQCTSQLLARITG
jgi:hypothetical protein